MREFHPLVKRWLDGELSADQLGAELAAELAEARALLGAVDRAPVTLDAEFEGRVMAAVRTRPIMRWGRAWRRGWQWIGEAHELRLRVRPWAVAALAAAATLVFIFAPARQAAAPRAVAQAPESVYVKFVLYAPGAHQVSVAGTFNGWDARATPLAHAAAPGVWAATLSLPAGQHLYAFVVDGQRWVADPTAPGVDDGFGRRNSIIAVSPQGARVS
ncbi:MAG TPA: isoamylase early set domain-containing protein [Gemmatimonadales bacterium]